MPVRWSVVSATAYSFTREAFDMSRGTLKPRAPLCVFYVEYNGVRAFDQFGNALEFATYEAAETKGDELAKEYRTDRGCFRTRRDWL